MTATSEKFGSKDATPSIPGDAGGTTLDVALEQIRGVLVGLKPGMPAVFSGPMAPVILLGMALQQARGQLDPAQLAAMLAGLGQGQPQTVGAPEARKEAKRPVQDPLDSIAADAASSPVKVNQGKSRSSPPFEDGMTQRQPHAQAVAGALSNTSQAQAQEPGAAEKSIQPQSQPSSPELKWTKTDHSEGAAHPPVENPAAPGGFFEVPFHAARTGAEAAPEPPAQRVLQLQNRHDDKLNDTLDSLASQMDAAQRDVIAVVESIVARHASFLDRLAQLESQLAATNNLHASG